MEKKKSQNETEKVKTAKIKHMFVRLLLDDICFDRISRLQNPILI